MSVDRLGRVSNDMGRDTIADRRVRQPQEGWSAVELQAGEAVADTACSVIVGEIRRLVAAGRVPLLVALDGGSGAGKSTLAALIAKEVDAVLVHGDDFFAADVPDAGWNARSAAERAQDAIDWRRLRTEALEPLLASRPAKWRAFDFAAGPRPDGSYGMRMDHAKRAPALVILLEGAYAARPELANLIGLSVLVDVPLELRHARLAAREEAGFLEQWHARWDAAEAHYFTKVRPASSFDLVVANHGSRG